ncbi:MBOAT family protein [Roseburia sp. AF34-16]|mgnify:FL=1|jgi:alginate O-acetyltransferase complex protein AlgI|uniref:MBOAT family O-acyltransferase n=1 Tax=Roseburia sp. AF34-16 TaxID=2293136 RepID=UPI000E541FB1|nr:MBOAT family O-acyltransferase [Roseburia sp. AF34-16]RGF58996.1 MBOAT family protein [Roseburia sp. AF34-16]
MVFSSIAFIMYFMPVFFLVYYILPASYKNAWLFLASLGFYYYGVRGNPGYLLLMIMSVVVNFVAGKLIAAQKTKRARKAWLVVGVVYDLGWLILFKYLGFLIENLNALFGAMHVKVQLETWNLILPIGISFYTFQIISYLVDVYRRETKAEKSLISLGTYLCMFPQLIAGPIVNYHLIQEQLHKRKHSMEKVESGLKVFALGLAYKVLLANRVGHLWTEVTAIGYESISTPLAWMSIVAYSLQLYFDFYGYSLMAIGLGRMMGFDFPQNFNNPYMAVSMTDFWRRWHMTLGGWFREYVYIPLGGNRGGFAKTVRNMFVVWLLTGLWHGASWNFVLWGLLLFVLLFVEKAGLGKVLERHKALGHIYMILWIPLSWLVFVITDLSQLGIYLQKLFPFFGSTGTVLFQGDYLKYGKTYGIYLVLGILFATGVQEKLLKKNKNRLWVILLLLALFWASVYCMYLGMDDPFLYFRF